MRVVVIPGHNEQKQGASNKLLGKIENQVVKEIVMDIFMDEREMDIDLIIKKRNTLRDLPAEIAKINPDLVLEIHLNGSEHHNVQGTEVLVMNYAKKSRFYAEQLQKIMVEELDLRDRGVKGITRAENGGYLLEGLCKHDIPCMVVESFFMDEIKTDEEFMHLQSLTGKCVNRLLREMKKL